MKIKAYANDTTVMICWLPDAKIPNCLGFAIKRHDLTDGTTKVLTGQMPFPGQHNPDWHAQPTTVWPVQNMTWMDFSPTLEHSYKYEVVPMVGTPGNLQELSSAAATSNQVTVTTELSQYIKASFNRGILSTQWLARNGPKDAEGKLDLEALLKAIQTPGNPIREQLAGHIIEFLQQPVKVAAAEGGHVYMLFYELTDRQQIDFWKQHKDVWSMILSNTGKDKAGVPDGENAPFRKELHDAGCDVLDRMLANSYGIGHNKSQARLDKNGNPVEVVTTTANQTSPGFCGQANTAVRIVSAAVAQLYYEYWQQIKADTLAGSKQGPTLRSWCNTPRAAVTLPNGVTVEVLFSPETADTTKPPANQPPQTMARIFSAMHGAKQAIYGAWFYPGFPSVVSEIQYMYQHRPDLMFRCVISSAQALGNTPITPRPGEPPVIVVAAGVEQDFAEYVQEALLLPDAHAIIHSKVMSIDPLSDNCVVVISSHNQGFKASTVNDENTVIVRGDRAYAAAMMIHILDLYNHYYFRDRVQKKDPTLTGYLSPTDDWQDVHFTGFALKEAQYWTGVLEELTKGAQPHTSGSALETVAAAQKSSVEPHVVAAEKETAPANTGCGCRSNGCGGASNNARKAGRVRSAVRRALRWIGWVA